MSDTKPMMDGRLEMLRCLFLAAREEHDYESSSEATFVEEAHELFAELDRLRAQIAPLPKTADGIPIYPGMRCVDMTNSREVRVSEVFKSGVDVINDQWYVVRLSLNELRSVDEKGGGA